MIVSTIDRDGAILTNIVDTLSQIKQGGVPNKPLVIPHAGGDCTVEFYVDAAKSVTLFSDSAADHPERFTVAATSTSYAVPDELINFAPSVSATYSQRVYYVTAGFGAYDDTVKNLTYRNGDNLLFQNVIVSSKRDPQFVENADTAILVAPQERVINTKANDDRLYVMLDYELYVQLSQFPCGFDDASRTLGLITVNNLIRNALYADRYRDGNATLYDENVNGTYVSPAVLLPSKELFKGMLKITCCYVTSSTGW